MQRESNAYFLKKHFGNFKAFQYRMAVFFGSLIRVTFVLILIPLLEVLKDKNKDSMRFTLRKYAYLFLWALGYKNRVEE